LLVTLLFNMGRRFRTVLLVWCTTLLGHRGSQEVP
jgi:hypothetical protein